LACSNSLNWRWPDYTEGARGNTGIPQEQALAVLLEKRNEVAGLFAGFDYSPFYSANVAPAVRLGRITSRHGTHLDQADGKTQFIPISDRIGLKPSPWRFHMRKHWQSAMKWRFSRQYGQLCQEHQHG